SHQSTEDVAGLRALPHLRILSPADRHEMTACMKLAIESEGPVYLRMGKADLGDVHQTTPRVEWGSLCPVRGGDGPIAWIATGSVIVPTLTAADQWPDSPIWSAPSIKPLDADEIVTICRRHAAVVVLEEHSVYGGLASAVAEIAAAHCPTWICPIGVPD